MTPQLRTLLSNLVIGSVAAGAAAMLAGTGCGGGSIYGGGGGGPTMDVRGNIADVLPSGTDRKIVVFVFTTKDEQPDCEHPVLMEDRSQFQSRSLDPGETEFEVRNAKAGHISVVFLLDEAGKDADARIDPGDPIAVLDDPDCVMDDVPNKYILFAEDVKLNFTLAPEVGFPAPGRAEAADLFEELE